MFITSFFYNITPVGPNGLCKDTEWEPIPVPERFRHGSTWINISIPKFKNPQKELYGNLTTNKDNTIGFAVYSDGIFVGNATDSNETHYFFNESVVSGIYHYRVAPIARGGYVTYGKSGSVEISVVDVSVNAPNGKEDWSGEHDHLINYTILGGTPLYIVELYYVNDEIPAFIGYDNRTEAGTYEYLWKAEKFDSEKMRIRVNITDNATATAWDISDENFTIDATPPIIETTSPEDNGSCSPSSSIAIEFNEFMNKTSVEAAFSYTNGTEIWTIANGEINWSDNVMMFTPYEEFEIGMQYNCTISIGAKDDSDPGNAMIKDYTWSFVAAPGRGNFTVDVKYPPSTVIEWEICQVKVTVINGVDAENRSGGLVVKFLKSSDGENFSIIDTKLVPGMFPNNSTTVYANFTLQEGTWYLKVNISLLSPDDAIMGSKGYYETDTYTVEATPSEQIKEKRMGTLPYALIVLMVVIVVLIGIYTIWSYKKKKRRH